MNCLSLNGSDWTLTGYWQNQWQFAKSGDLGQSRRVPVPAVPAIVPGAVHADLLRAGLIPDWQDGLNAERSEWINNREWMFAKQVTIPQEWGGIGSSVFLECDGLDYSGLVFVDGKEVGTFEGTHLRHRFDLTGLVRPGQTFKLEFLFNLSPQIEGVFGYTSKTRIFKPRFGYCWDWCPRVVNVGIWQDVRLVMRGPSRFQHVRVQARLSDDLNTGTVRVIGEIAGGPAVARYQLTDSESAVVASGAQACPAGPLNLKIAVNQPKLWWPGRGGDLYRLSVEIVDESGRVSDVLERTVGFRCVRWLDNPGAPAGAKPYLCEVNGVQTFIRGINWVPLSPFYGTVSRARYQAVLGLYRNMNVNLVRVWGGAILETEDFYELCDELGIMVWQEFPLSSSGIENWPPEDPAVVEHLQTIATEYVERRGHHASHVLWCGGNELQGSADGGKQGIGRPVDELHPLMLRWQELLARIDPGKRFQATSPSGPTFYAHAENLGKGIHHQTHGPWGWGDVPFASWHAYWNRDDSLFRSENGVPGCSSMAALERHKGDQSLWPPTEANRHWVVPAAAWIPWDDVIAAFGEMPEVPESLPLVVKAHRYMQAESYRYAAEACRRRFPNCSGYIIWMGHDNLHNTSNNSVIQIDGSTKPAYDWLQRAFADHHVSLRYDSICCPAGERFRGRVFVHADAPGGQPPAGHWPRRREGLLRAALVTMEGEVIDSAECAVTEPTGSVEAVELDWKPPVCPQGLFLVDLQWESGSGLISNRYLFSQSCEHPLRPLLHLPPADLTVRRDPNGGVTVANQGQMAGIGVRLTTSSPGCAILARCNNMILLRGESCTFEYRLVPMEAERGGAGLVVECFNTPGFRGE